MGIIAVYGEEAPMLKFKFDYLTNTLAYQRENLWHQIAEEQQFQGQFGAVGFKLNSGWITFTLSPNKIRAFYKQIDNPTWITYYRKDLPKEAPIIFEFTEADEVEKTNGKWTKKGGIHA